MFKTPAIGFKPASDARELCVRPNKEAAIRRSTTRAPYRHRFIVASPFPKQTVKTILVSVVNSGSGKSPVTRVVLWVPSESYSPRGIHLQKVHIYLGFIGVPRTQNIMAALPPSPQDDTTPPLPLNEAEDLLIDLTGRVKTIGNYAFGSGGCSDVYKAVLKGPVDTEIKVVIKVFRGSMLSSNEAVPAVQQNTESHSIEKAKRRFHRECKLWHQLTHDNVLPCLGYSFDENLGVVPGLISPFCEFGNAFAYLNSEHAKSQPDARLDIIIGAAKGVQYLHARGIVHGDLKGRNVLVDDKGIACVTDFGISRVLDQRGYTTNLSTTFYMAPEHFGELDGEPTGLALKTESDVYAFGMVILELLSGKLAWYGHKTENVVLRVASGRRPDRQKYDPLKDREWALIQQCWAQDPAERPAMKQIIIPHLISWKDTPGV